MKSIKLFLMIIFLMSIICTRPCPAQIGQPGSNWRLFWKPVTTNSDGLPCVDLAGYKVYANSVGYWVIPPDTSILFSDLQEMTDFYVVAYDMAGNVSAPSSIIRITIVAEKIPVSNFKSVWTVEDFATCLGGEGTLSDDRIRLGIYDADGTYEAMTLRFEVTPDSAGNYTFAINASAKSAGARLSVNGAWTSTLTSIASLYRVKIPLVAGVNQIEIVTDGDVYLWRDALTITYSGKIGIDIIPPITPQGWGCEEIK
jgi:hypothetical protein